MPLRARVDGALRVGLPARLAGALEPVLDGAEGIVRIRRLRIALSLTGALEEAALARIVAARIAAEVKEALSRPGDDVRIWPDAASYVASYAEARLGLERVPDWAFPEFAALLHLSPVDAAAEAIKAHPACLAELARRGRSAGDAARIVPRIGAERLAPLLLQGAPHARAEAQPDPARLPRLLRLLAARRARSSAEPPVSAALGAAFEALAEDRGDAVAAVLATARLATTLDALARDHAEIHGAPLRPGALALPADLPRSLPSGWRELWRRDLADPAVAAALSRGLRVTDPSRPPRPPAPDVPDADAAIAPRRPAQRRRLTSAHAGLGLLVPLVAQHGLHRHLGPRALNGTVLATMPPDEAKALRIDPVVGALFPFDPHERDAPPPPVPEALLDLLPEAKRPPVAEASGIEAWGRFLMARFADLLPGLRESSPAYLRRQFLCRHGALEIGAERIALDLPGIPLGIVLRMAGFSGPQGRVPHLGERPFEISLGGDGR